MRKIIAFSLLLVTLTVPARPGFIQDVWGIATDPFKLGKSTDNLLAAIERSAIHAERIEGRINGDVQARIEQFNGVVRDTLAGMTAALDKADEVAGRNIGRITTLQREIFSSTSDLVKCSTTVSTDIVLRKISGSLNEIGVRRPRINIFGFTLIEVKFDKSDFDSPIGAFRKFISLMDHKLTSIKETDPVPEIIDIYGEVQRNADLVRCHYKVDTGLFAELYETELEFNRRERVWIGQYYPRNGSKL